MLEDLSGGNAQDLRHRIFGMPSEQAVRNRNENPLAGSMGGAEFNAKSDAADGFRDDFNFPYASTNM